MKKRSVSSPVLPTTEDTTIDTEILKCVICYDTFTSPRTLPCLHTFCEGCLEMYIDCTISRMGTTTRPLGREFRCPTCRARTTVPPQGAKGFHHDFRINQMQEILKRYKGLPTGSCDSVLICGFCLVVDCEKNESYFCKECEKCLCYNCKVKHDEINVLGVHTLVPLIQGARSPLKDNQTCTTHKGQRSQYYCGRCDDTLCSLCVIKDERCKTHALQEIDIVMQERQTVLRAAVSKLESKIKILESSLTNYIEKSLNLRQRQADVANQIHTRAQNLISQIYTEKQQLLDALNKRCEDELTLMKVSQDLATTDLYECRQILRKSRTLMEKKQNARHLVSYRETSNEIQKAFTELSSTDFNDDVVVHFIEQSQTFELGHVVVSNQNSVDDCTSTSYNSEVFTGTVVATTRNHFRLSINIGKFGTGGGEFNTPRDVCILPNQNIIVADSVNERFQIFDTKGLLIQALQPSKIRPWGITALYDGNIAVADNYEKCVKIIQPNGQILKRFGKFLSPCAITQDTDGNLVVSDFFNAFLYILNLDGKLMRKIEFRGDDDNQTCGASRVSVGPAGEYVISDVSNGSVKVFDKNGTFVRKLSYPHVPISPQGVAVDECGNIYLCDSIRREILMYDSRGEFVECVVCKEDRLKDPIGLAVKDDLMVVTQIKTNTVSIFRRCKD